MSRLIRFYFNSHPRNSLLLCLSSPPPTIIRRDLREVLPQIRPEIFFMRISNLNRRIWGVHRIALLKMSVGQRDSCLTQFPFALLAVFLIKILQTILTFQFRLV